MFKERALDFDWGRCLHHNHYHSGISIGTWTSSLEQMGYLSYSDLVERHYEAASAANVVFSGLYGPSDGYEKFTSTKRIRPVFNDCEHLLYKGISTPCSFVGTGYRTKYWNCYPYYRFRPDAFGSFSDEIVLVEKHLYADLRNAQATAWGTMQPRFEGQVSMFNFLVELKDFKSLFHLLRNKPLEKIGRYFRKLKKSKDITKPLAEMHLASEFALKPLLNDIMVITSQIETVVQQAQQEFADAGSGRSSRHYTEVFEGDMSSTVSSTAAKYMKYGNSGKQEHLTFTATMEYSYNYSLRNQLDAFMQYWGLYPTPEAIWNAIPFTFLADYIIGMGDAIRVMSRDKHVDLSLHQYCESLLTERSSGAYIRPEMLLTGFVGNRSLSLDELPSYDILVAGVTSSLYSRRTTSPNKGLVIPRIKIPSSKQGWNCAALLRCFF